MLDGWLGLGAFSVRRSTPAERVVLVWVVILASAAIGVACLYLGFTAPPDKAAAAETLRLCGYLAIALSVTTWVLNRLVTWLLDR